MHRAVVERQRLGSDLQMALAKGELEVHYQPLVDLTTGVVAGVEALLRWHHPTRGSIPPASFIPVAEEIGVIVDIGVRVLDQACHQVVDWTTRHEAVWRPGGHRQPVAGAARHHAPLPGRRGSDRALGHRAVEPHPRDHRGGAERRRRGGGDRGRAPPLLGVRLAIDDFGTGYRRFLQPRMLPVDMLKIDKSFIDGTADGGRGTALLHLDHRPRTGAEPRGGGRGHRAPRAGRGAAPQRVPPGPGLLLRGAGLARGPRGPHGVARGPARAALPID
ncbi:MAG: EAL domain-containing protein [Acidimicrobiales bacterium]